MTQASRSSGPAKLTAGRVSLALLAAMLVLPFLNPLHRFPVTSFHTEWIATVLALMAWAVWFWRRKDVHIPWVVLLPIGLIGVVALQIAFDRLPRAEPGWLVIAYLGLAAMMALLGASIVRSQSLETVVTPLAWALLCGGMLTAIAGIMQALPGPMPIDGWLPKQLGRISGPISQANHQASYYAIAWVSAVYLWHRHTGALRVPIVISALACLVALPLTGSRSGFLFMSAALGWAAWYGWRSTFAAWRTWLLMLAGGFALYVIVQFVAPGVITWLQQAGDAQAGDALQANSPVRRMFEESAGYASRFQVWREAAVMGWNSPGLGVGVGQFAWNHFLLALSMPNPYSHMLFNNAHNTVFHVMAEMGMLAALGLVAMAVWLFWHLALRRPAADHWWVISVLSVLDIHSLLEYPLWYVYFLAPFAFLLGAISPAVELTSGRLVSVFRHTLAGIFIVGIGVFGNISASLSELDGLLVATARGYFTQQDAPALVETLDLIHRGSLAAPYIDSVYIDALPPSDSPEYRQISERVVRFWPEPHVLAKHILALSLAGEADEVQRLIRHAVAAFPGFHGVLAGVVKDIPLEKLPGIRETFEAVQRLRDIRAGIVSKTQAEP